MTSVGLIGLFLSLGVVMIFARSGQKRWLLLFALMVTHIGASLLYYNYALTAPADSSLYYEGLGLERLPFSFGTVFVVKLVQSLKDVIGGSYLDYFLMFQVFGLAGIALLVRVFDEIHASLNTHAPAISYALLFMPGLHFWSSAIGKDAPLLFAISLSVWSVLSLRRRLIPLAAALVIMVLFRPHIALIVVMALATALLVDTRSSLGSRLALLIVVAISAVFIATSVESTFTVSIRSPDSIAEFFSRQNEVSQSISGTTSVQDASFLVKLMSQLFRPIFFDAPGVLGFVASIESLSLIIIHIILIWNWKEVVHLTRSVFFIKFVLLLFVTLTFFLALIFYNVGLALRMRLMLFPELFSLFVALIAYHGRVRVLAGYCASAAKTLQEERLPPQKPPVVGRG